MPSFDQLLRRLPNESAGRPDDGIAVDDRPLRLGVELEWPQSTGVGYGTLTQQARTSSQDDFLSGRSTDWAPGGNVETDHVGAEITMRPPQSPSETIDWYRQSIETGVEEFGVGHEPCGSLANGSTAGLHIHISELTAEEAQRLWDFSTEPWMEVFVCSALFDGDYRPFRYRYASRDANGPTSGNYAVNSAPRGGHYEWRLPEPMTREHFPLVIEFLVRFRTEGPDAARDWARDLVIAGDERLTSIRRAEALDLVAVFTDRDDRDTVQIARAPHRETSAFYWSVADNSSQPYIFRVDTPDGVYYTFRTYEGDDEQYTLSEFNADYKPGEIVDAETLDRVGDPDLRSQVEEALAHPMPFGDPHEGDDTPRFDDATDLLVEAIG